MMGQATKASMNFEEWRSCHPGDFEDLLASFNHDAEALRLCFESLTFESVDLIMLHSRLGKQSGDRDLAYEAGRRRLPIADVADRYIEAASRLGAYRVQLVMSTLAAHQRKERA